ncbi:MAG: uroporphyrinogen-III synthase [Fluviicola sp.]
MIKSLFISKNPAEVTELQSFADTNSFRITAKSFLQFKPVPFDVPKEYQVIFFSSPRAVTFFHSRYSVPSGVHIASVGGKTTALLKSMGYEVAFTGEDKGSISEVATSFQNWLGDRKVLFPVSTKSLGTISKGLPPDQTIHVTCYETQIQEHILESTFDVYVFTSPSNVEGFFAQNKLDGVSTVIAWGDSTAMALKKHQVFNFDVLREPSQSTLSSLLMKKV